MHNHKTGSISGSRLRIRSTGPLLSVLLAGSLAACATGPMFPGETKMNQFRAQDGATTWQSVVWTDKQKHPGCEVYTLLDTKLLSYDEPIVFENNQATKGKFSEVWTYDRCGIRVEQRIIVVIQGPEQVLVRTSGPVSI